jgi:hypothetical protein
MAYPVSTIPAAYAYLFNAFQTQLNTDPTADQILLFTGDDPGPNAPNDLVAIVNVVRQLEHFAMVGDGEDLAMYEKYSIYVKFSSAQRAASQLEAATYLVPRVWKLLSYCEYAVRLDPALGGIVLTAWPGMTQDGLVAVATDMNGWLCELTWQVDIEATQ